MRPVESPSAVGIFKTVFFFLGVLAILFFSFTHVASADGSQTYTTPGTYTFAVPAYGTLTVQVWGGGGGGGGAGGAGTYYAGAGGAGGVSYFSSVVAYGGAGGPYSLGNNNTGSAAGGSASGGTTNIAGSAGGSGQAYAGYCYCSGAGGTAPSGGAGGASVTGMQGGYFASGNSGGVPGAGGSGGTFRFGSHILHAGGGGGSGAYSSRTYTAGAIAGSVTVVVGGGGAGGGPSSQGGNYGGAGAAGRVTVTWTTATPSCTINATPTTINQPSGTALTWTSTNATTFHITRINYVTPNVSGGTTDYPSATVTYTGTATGPGGTGTCTRTVTVNRSCTLNGNTIVHGASATAYQASTVPYGNSCVSQTRTCTDGTLSGTYTHASCSVTPAANCTFNGNTVSHGASVTAYQSSSVPYGSSCSSQSRSCSNGTLSGSYAHASCSVTPAANCTLNGVTVLHGASRTFYTQQTAPVGQLCSAISQSRTCTNGTLSGTASYQYGSCLCAPIYSCSGSNIRYTNSACSTSTVATCSLPGYCTAGQSTCQYDDIGYNSFSATTTSAASGGSGSGTAFTATGHLEARPALVRTGDRSRLFWNVSSAQNCTVTGTNGDSWTQTSTPSWGVLTLPITALTRFTLTCDAYPTVLPATITETASVLPSPQYGEI